jgi:flagellar basal body P-ring formation protein FlgA
MAVRWHTTCFDYRMNRSSPRIVCFLTLVVAASSMAHAQTMQSPDDLRRAAEAFMVERLHIAGSGVVTHATAAALDSRLRLQSCTRPLQGLLATGAQVTANITVGVRCTSPLWTVYVPVAIESEMKVLVLRQAATRNAALGPADIEVQTRRVPGAAASYLTTVDQLQGRHLRMPAAPGTALTVEQFAADILVKRGQRVTLVASLGGLEVRAQGEAMADATATGRVRVLNLSSRKVVEGQVESTDRVRVSL